MARITKWEFRLRLHGITERASEVARERGIGPASAWQVKALLELNSDYERSISLVARRPACPSDDYNCFEFASGIRPRIGKRRLTANSEFVDILIRGMDGRGGFLAARTEQSHAVGDIILYWAGAKVRTHPEHAGVVVSEGAVVSKWGFGDLLMHGVEEVPSNYGMHWAYFVRPDPEEVEVEFMRYARWRGLV